MGGIWASYMSIWARDESLVGIGCQEGPISHVLFQLSLVRGLVLTLQERDPDKKNKIITTRMQ